MLPVSFAVGAIYNFHLRFTVKLIPSNNQERSLIEMTTVHHPQFNTVRWFALAIYFDIRTKSHGL